MLFIFFFMLKTAYDMRITDWISDVFSTDLLHHLPARALREQDDGAFRREGRDPRGRSRRCRAAARNPRRTEGAARGTIRDIGRWPARQAAARRSEEHTSELQSLMRISYAVFCLKK